jgi:pyruvate kinase
VLTQEELLAKACLRIEDAVHFATMDLADKVCARYLVGFTNSGASVLGLAKFRPLAPLIAFSPKPATLRKLALVWGVDAAATGRRRHLGGRSVEFRHRILLNKGMVREGEIVVFTAGVPVGRIRRREHDQGGEGGKSRLRIRQLIGSSHVT